MEISVKNDLGSKVEGNISDGFFVGEAIFGGSLYASSPFRTFSLGEEDNPIPVKDLLKAMSRYNSWRPYFQKSDSKGIRFLKENGIKFKK